MFSGRAFKLLSDVRKESRVPIRLDRMGCDGDDFCVQHLSGVCWKRRIGSSTTTTTKTITFATYRPKPTRYRRDDDPDDDSEETLQRKRRQAEVERIQRAFNSENHMTAPKLKKLLLKNFKRDIGDTADIQVCVDKAEGRRFLLVIMKKKHDDDVDERGYDGDDDEDDEDDMYGHRIIKDDASLSRAVDVINALNAKDRLEEALMRLPPVLPVFIDLGVAPRKCYIGGISASSYMT